MATCLQLERSLRSYPDFLGKSAPLSTAHAREHAALASVQKSHKAGAYVNGLTTHLTESHLFNSDGTLPEDTAVLGQYHRALHDAALKSAIRNAELGQALT